VNFVAEENIDKGRKPWNHEKRYASGDFRNRVSIPG
jgi:hypothetical protein